MVLSLKFSLLNFTTLKPLKKNPITNKVYLYVQAFNWIELIFLRFIHLLDAFIQSDLQVRIYRSSVLFFTYLIYDLLFYSVHKIIFLSLSLTSLSGPVTYIVLHVHFVHLCKKKLMIFTNVLLEVRQSDSPAPKVTPVVESMFCWSGCSNKQSFVLTATQVTSESETTPNCPQILNRLTFLLMACQIYLIILYTERLFGLEREYILMSSPA